MNKRIKTLIILAAVLAGGIIAAVIAYNTLSSRVTPVDASAAAGNGNIAASEAAEQQSQGKTVSVPGAEGTAESTGEAAADFTMLDNEGKEVRLSEHFGKPIVINFWATWCPPCKQEMPAFDKAYQERGDIVDFMMVNLTDGVRDDVLSVQEFVRESGYKFPVYFDSARQGAAEYGVMYIPTTVFINADGTVLETHSGAISEDRLNSYLDTLLSPQ